MEGQRVRTTDTVDQGENTSGSHNSLFDSDPHDGLGVDTQGNSWIFDSESAQGQIASDMEEGNADSLVTSDVAPIEAAKESGSEGITAVR